MKALYPGSFSPFHKGHEYVYKTAMEMFGDVDIAIFDNIGKGGKSFYFGVNYKWVLKPISNNVVYREGHLVSDYIKNNPEIKVIVKGVRNQQDFLNETAQAHWNEKLCGVKTVLIPTPTEFQHLSSSAIREINNIDYLKELIDPIHYRRWKCPVVKNTIYFGKIAIGKSTYLKKSRGEDADILIFDITGNRLDKQEIKTSFMKAIQEGDHEKYNLLIKQVANVITDKDWEYLFNHCNEISVLPVYWKYIPDSIKAKFRFIELYATDEDRIKHKFWIDMPFIDERILI